MQELNQNPGKQYITMKVSKESRAVLWEIQQNDPLWGRIDVKDVIALAWPRCPACGGAITTKFASANLICVKCRNEYQLTRI
jgi:hypothetical protein